MRRQSKDDVSPREEHPRHSARDEAARPRSYEADVAEGLEDLARDEVARRLESRATHLAVRVSRRAPSAVAFDYLGDPAALLELRTVLAVSLVYRVAVPRPRAMLGDACLRDLLAQIDLVRGLTPASGYRTLSVGAAGSDSAVLTRLKAELAGRMGLRLADGEADLYLRLRRPPDGGEGWEVLIRLTPRPLATRAWRVRNPPGALNATVAHAMALLTRPRPDDVFLNVACGSGTLLIERLVCGRARRVMGCDISAAAREDAAANVGASGHGPDVEVHDWDARALPLPEGSVDALCADLPFGHAVGSHDENVALYPQILAEAARVATPDAKFALLTHEVRLMEALLEQSAEWTIEEQRRVRLGGLYPRIFVLRRR